MADDNEFTSADEALARLVRDALGADPLPPGLLDRAAELVTMADLDAELASLADESVEELAGLRGGAAAPTVHRFTSPDGAVTVELTVATGRLDGVVVGPPVDVVVVQRADGTRVTGVVDELGQFTVDGLPAGPARLVVGNPPALVATDWFVL